jgi:hypothetical protein
MDEDADELDEAEELDTDADADDLDAHAGMQTVVTIEISGLSLFTHVGVSAAEREVGQRLLFDIRIDVGESDATETDRIEDTIDYGEVCQLVAKRSSVSAPSWPTASSRTSVPMRSGSRRQSRSRRSRCRSRRSLSRSGASCLNEQRCVPPL